MNEVKKSEKLSFVQEFFLHLANEFEAKANDTFKAHPYPETFGYAVGEVYYAVSQLFYGLV
jgi:hypothetical protein